MTTSISAADGLYIRETGVYGKGVFARSGYRRGAVIPVLSGRRFTLEEMVVDVLAGEEAMNDPLQVGLRTYIDLDELSRTFNHSCRPNAGVRKRSELFALRDVLASEEITYDYSQTIAPTAWEMECRCGVPECRKLIHDIRSIPRDQLAYHKRSGAVQRYMRPLLEAIEDGSYRIPQYEIRALLRLGYSAEQIKG